MAKATNKARKIFEDTYMECRLHVKNWGELRQPDGRAVGFNSLITNEVTCKRTWNAIQALIDRESNNLDLEERLDVLRPERLKVLRFALEMVQETLNNEMRNWAV